MTRSSGFSTCNSTGRSFTRHHDTDDKHDKLHCVYSCLGAFTRAGQEWVDPADPWPCRWWGDCSDLRGRILRAWWGGGSGGCACGRAARIGFSCECQSACGVVLQWLAQCRAQANANVKNYLAISKYDFDNSGGL